MLERGQCHVSGCHSFHLICAARDVETRGTAVQTPAAASAPEEPDNGGAAAGAALGIGSGPSGNGRGPHPMGPAESGRPAARTPGSASAQPPPAPQFAPISQAALLSALQRSLSPDPVLAQVIQSLAGGVEHPSCRLPDASVIRGSGATGGNRRERQVCKRCVIDRYAWNSG